MSEQQSRRMFKAGDIILKQGEKGDCAYIIEDGQVEISICRSDGNTQIISTRGPGTIIGEMAIVDEAPRVATVKALKDCKMLEITREDFAQRLKTSDPVIQMVSQEWPDQTVMMSFSLSARSLSIFWTVWSVNF